MTKKEAWALVEAYQEWERETKLSPAAFMRHLRVEIKTQSDSSKPLSFSTPTAIARAAAIVRAQCNEMIAKEETVRQEEYERKTGECYCQCKPEPVYYISFDEWKEDHIERLIYTPYRSIDDCIEAYHLYTVHGNYKLSVYRVDNNIIEWFDIDAHIASHEGE